MWTRELQQKRIAGLVEIDAAQGVILQNLTVQNSLCDGIFLQRVVRNPA